METPNNFLRINGFIISAFISGVAFGLSLAQLWLSLEIRKSLEITKKEIEKEIRKESELREKKITAFGQERYAQEFGK